MALYHVIAWFDYSGNYLVADKEWNASLPVQDPGIPVWSGDQKTWVLALEDPITNKAIISVTPSLWTYLIFVYPLSSHSPGYWGGLNGNVCDRCLETAKLYKM